MFVKGGLGFIVVNGVFFTYDAKKKLDGLHGLAHPYREMWYCIRDNADISKEINPSDM